MEIQNYLFLTLSILLAGFNNITLKYFKNKTLRNFGEILLFNSAVAVTWLTLFVVVGKGFQMPSFETCLYGIAYGVITACFLMAKTLALANGPISITSLIGCCALLVPTLFGAFFWHEKVIIPQIIGIVLLLVSMYLCANVKNDKTYTVKWKIYCLLFFIFGGFVGVIMKAHQTSGSAAQLNEMMIVAALTMIVIYTISAFAVNKVQRQPMPKLTVPYTVIIAVLCGLFSGGYNRFNIYLTGVIPSVIFFPIFNGCVILLTTLTGCFFFKEKLKSKQLAGIVLGTAAIMLIGNVFFK